MKKQITAAVANPFMLIISFSCSQQSEAPAEVDSSLTPAYETVIINEPIQPIPLRVRLDLKKTALGERLFHDPRLSKNDTIACSSCHSLSLGGTDRRSKSIGLDNAVTEFNSPTVFNSGFNFTQFWDGRVETLEEQIEETTHSIIEMGSNWEEMLEKIGTDPEYRKAFAETYSEGVTRQSITNALAEFLRSLYTPNSRFDRYLRGEQNAITEQEKEGYFLFKTYGCVTCHQGIGVGGNIFESFGVQGNPFEQGSTSRDLGRYNITGREEDKYVFKVPGLRNVALTQPYFHDGSVESLEAAVSIMARYQLGRELESQEVELIVAFLKTLTGEYKGRPLDENPELMQ